MHHHLGSLLLYKLHGVIGESMEIRLNWGLVQTSASRRQLAPFSNESPTDLDNVIIILMKSRYCSMQLANISDHVTWSSDCRVFWTITTKKLGQHYHHFDAFCLRARNPRFLMPLFGQKTGFRARMNKMKIGDSVLCSVYCSENSTKFQTTYMIMLPKPL